MVKKKEQQTTQQPSVKLGHIRSQDRIPRVNFRNWQKDFYKEGIKYELPVIRIFTPSRFPNFTFIMRDHENVLEVSRTFRPNQAKEILKLFGFSTKKPTPGTLYLIIDETGEMEVTYLPEQSREYVYTQTGWVLQEISESEESLEEELPF